MKAALHSSSKFWFLLLLLAGLLGTACAELPSNDGGPSVVVIDLHTHVFNARDLPLAGAIDAMGRSWVSKPVADVLKKALLALTLADDLEGPFPPAGKPVEGSAIMSLDAKAAAPKSALPRTLPENLRAQVRVFAGLKPEAGVRLMKETDQAKADRKLVADALRKAGFPPPESDEPEPEMKIQSVGVDGYVRFVNIMTDGHLRIAYRLMAEEYPQVDLFVHHMMDMERAYDEAPEFRFDEQMERMNRLGRRLEGAYAGRLLHFTAFDPFRREQALGMAVRGLQAGAVGVKFYPPSGYRATSNDIPRRPKGWFSPRADRERWDARYKGLTDEALDDLNEQFFRYCASNDVPIFAHCTPQGFEADKDYGWMADPVYWGQVLARHPTLRLCLGHAGGEAYWFADDTKRVKPEEYKQRTFGTNVVELCLKYPNVYCEVGYLDGVLDKDKASLFTNRLASVIHRASLDGKWTFGDKLIYGTDWHMMHKVDHHKQYLSVFDGILAQPMFNGYRRRFFAGNAVEYLKLKLLSEDGRFTEAQRDAWRRIVARTR